jgi:biotin carboxylase
MRRRILVTAAGGTLAPLNIKLMKQSRHRDVFVLAVDARPDAIGRYFADAFAQVPAGDDPVYADAVIDLVRQHRIEIVLPWSDEEALALAVRRTDLETGGALLACADLSALRVMSDKFATYELMQKVGIAMPAFRKVATRSDLELTVAEFNKTFGEFAVKPVSARGNRGTVVVRKDVKGAQNYLGSRELHMDIDTFRREHLNMMPVPAIVMERLDAPAYDIDVLALEGRVLRAMPRRRLNPAGIPFAGGVLVPTKPLLELADRITAALNLSWLYDYDLMTNARGEAIPIEINPRPSGSIAAAILAGVPFYDDLIAMANGLPVEPMRLPQDIAVVPYMNCRVVPAGQLA